MDRVTYEQAVEWVAERIRTRTPSRVGAVNAAKLVKLERDPVLARAVTSCELILADGMSVTWASRVLTGTGLHRVAGIDLMEDLVAAAAERGWSLYFLGATQEVLDEMLHVFEGRYPGLRVAGSRNGYFGPDEETAIVETVRDSGADILFVAMGTPAKELFIDRHFRNLGIPVSMGVGGSFDVLSGYVTRAPGWMQRLGLEWFYRLSQEPGRLWKRYLTTSSIFIGEVFMRSLQRAFRRGPGA